MAGLVPAIHVFAGLEHDPEKWEPVFRKDHALLDEDVDARHEAGHDALDKTMHDIRFIREHPEAFDRGLARRGLEPQAQRLIALDEKRRAAILAMETAQARRNAASKEIGEAKKARDEEKAKGLLIEVAALKESMPALEAEEKKTTAALNDALAELPNLPRDNVPDGTDASDNVERHHFGAKRNYAFAPKQHFDLGEALGQIDFETAAKLSGARFVVLKKGLARLERALGQFMLDVQTSEPHNYTEVAPPLLVRDEAMFGTAQLPKFRSDQFLASWEIDNLLDAPSNSRWIMKNRRPDEVRKIAEKIVAIPHEDEAESEHGEDGSLVLRAFLGGLDVKSLGQILWLIPTAEVPLTNLVRESILDEAQLPMRFTAGTPCFRAEAGAAGKDTRGMIRQHQFNKVELVSITTPEQSPDEHERMLSCAEEVLKRLELHYRVVTLCAGDMGFASQKTYDIEVWLPGQGAYREISSCSNCGEFQARRMNARYRAKEGRQVRHVHTLNGSGVAVGRALIAVLETYQQENGAIAVPEALAPYMGGIKTIEKQ
jgi:seryl-tRNA synthetase